MFEGRYHERNHKPEKPVMWRTAVRERPGGGTAVRMVIWYNTSQ